MTIDGSFTIGAALFASSIVAGFSTPISMLIAAIGGVVGGLLTWIINQKLGVGKIVSGILTMIILTLTAPYLSGGSSVSLINVDNFYSYIESLDNSITHSIAKNLSFQLHFVFICIILSLTALTVFTLILFLKTPIGLKLRYLGSAKKTLLIPKKQGQLLLLMALTLGNSLVAIGGAIEAQRRGGFTVNMGTGIILVGLTALILGESICKSYWRRSFLRIKESIGAIAIGCVTYTLGVQLILMIGIDFLDLRLITAIFLLLLLAFVGRRHSSSTQLF